MKLKDFVGAKQSTRRGRSVYAKSLREVHGDAAGGNITRNRLKGEGAFASAKTHPYQPKGRVEGQLTETSCVAASCRMLLQDHGTNVVETHLREALATDELGARISDAPAVLRQFGLPRPYTYRDDLAMADLQEATKRGAAIVFLKVPKLGAHALLVDGIEDDLVLIRDSLPIGRGAAYKVSATDFQKAWLHKRTGLGRAAVVE